MRQSNARAVATLLLVACLGAAPALGQAANDERAPRGQQPATTGPQLHIEQTEIDLGRIQAGEDAVATFVVQNRGTAELRILKAKAG